MFHELGLWHNTGNAALFFNPNLHIQPGEHVENPETKRRLNNLVQATSMADHLVHMKPRPATEDELARVHTREHIDRIRRMSEAGGGDASVLTPFGQNSFEIAQLAAGGAIVALEAVLLGKVDNAYALIRPPGHHALPDLGMGFCLFANIPVAIQHARAVHGLGRVAVIDWDVHHGNGTQACFYEDPATLTISLHQDNLFPANSGLVTERGAGPGFGQNLNVPLPAGCGHGAYLAAIQRVVLPALDRFRPDVIVIACGFDASALDPLGRMMLSSDSFREMTALVMEAADRLCGGRIMATHEGGYSAGYVPYCGLAVLEQLSGHRTGVEDPFLPVVTGYGQQDLQPHQSTAIDAAAALLPGVKGP